MDIRTALNLVEGRPSRHSTTIPPHMEQPATPVGQYLFHGTPLFYTLHILRMNMIGTGGQWHNEGDRVSTTREYPVAADFGTHGDWGQYPSVLVLDWRKLAQNYRIVPYTDHHQVDAGHDRAGQTIKNSFSTDGTEAEECIYGNIKPLSKYLVSVNVPPDLMQRAMTDKEYWESSEGETDLSPKILMNMVRRLAQSPILNRIHP